MTAAWQLPAELAASGPRVIGATGGSGTRVLARIARAGGLFTGARLNDYEDAVDFGAYSDRWINTWVSANGSLPDSEHEKMTTDLERVVESHCADRPVDARAWGWKEPRSIYLLPYYDETMPTFRFVHFVRDGRDMAFSENQNQLRKHGSVVLEPDQRRLETPLQSIVVWTRINARAADYGEQVLGDRYLRVRFEDLCSEPATSARRVYDFFGLEGDAEGVATEAVAPPSTLGRWRDEKSETVRGLEEIAGPVLDRFGYR
ncbi:MAG: sulfotransferase [Actinobacteria bacterium]|nr:sulfotransferase [Actinomycetota bacterium]